MDFVGLQAELAALGVTLTYEDDPPNQAAELQEQRQYRASLYLQHLTETRNFLRTTLAGQAPGGLGDDYPFVAKALGSPRLLDDLAATLDEWLCPAVERAMSDAKVRPTTYAGWFSDAVFDRAAYAANVRTFFTTYPSIDHVLTTIADNFRKNLEVACRRIVADQAAITALFSDRYVGLVLSALTEIKSTGSDFHKGGKQVLVLTFATDSFTGWWRVASTLRLIYKPADLEVDCLIAGESAAVNRATNNPAFMAKSLVEIFNATAAANTAVGLEQLPTYRILPRNRTSPLPQPAVGSPLPIRDAYGYVEYLGYSLTGDTYKFFNYYPFGMSDFVIFPSQGEAPVIERFYHQMGQLLALAVTFSLHDLHVENVRVSRYQAHLIDLEISLTSATQRVEQTVLLHDDYGGINGSSRANDFVWIVKRRTAGSPPVLQFNFHQLFLMKWYQNRLWAMRPNKRLVKVNVFWLLEGLQNGMSILRTAQAANAFAPWFARLTNVLVRVPPISTTLWINVRKAVYITSMNSHADFGPALTAVLDVELSEAYWRYQGTPTPEPDFVAYAAPQAASDLANFDIPVFYHRIGSSDMLDSTGAVVAVPAQLNVLNRARTPAPTLVNTNVGRATYFARPPTGARVLRQVEALTGPGYAALLTQWQQQTLVELGLDSAPPAPGKLIS